MKSSARVTAHSHDDDDSWWLEHARLSEPDNELPVPLAVSAVLGEADGVVVYLSGLRVYSNGVAFTLESRTSPDRAGDEPSSLYVGGFGPGWVADNPLLGVEYADGRRGFYLGTHGGETAGDDGTLSLRSGRGSGGGDGTSYSEMFLAPLPPGGPVRIICAWPSKGVEETATRLDGDQIVEAAGGVRELWPLQPPRRPVYVRPPLPELPAGGWFAELDLGDD